MTTHKICRYKVISTIITNLIRFIESNLDLFQNCTNLLQQGDGFLDIFIIDTINTNRNIDLSAAVYHVFYEALFPLLASRNIHNEKKIPYIFCDCVSIIVNLTPISCGKVQQTMYYIICHFFYTHYRKRTVSSLRV